MDLWNEIENRKTTEKINKTKSCVSENINKIDKTLARLTKKKKEESNKLSPSWKKQYYKWYYRNT